MRLNVKIANVTGEVISTEKNKRLLGYPLLVLDILDLDGKETGKEVVAFDSIGVGRGEKVLVTIEGDAAVQIMGFQDAPVDAVIVGKIDSVNLNEKYL
jgi:microcompartment protein CcmK/EutM